MAEQTSGNTYDRHSLPLLLLGAAGEVLKKLLTLGPHGNTQVEWADVVVGDLVRVKNWQPFPSDLLLISSSSADGQCYIETSNLDGYTSFPSFLIIVTIRSCFSF
jgi:hypothetical protein